MNLSVYDSAVIFDFLADYDQISNWAIFVYGIDKKFYDDDNDKFPSLYDILYAINLDNSLTHRYKSVMPISRADACLIIQAMILNVDWEIVNEEFCIQCTPRDFLDGFQIFKDETPLIKDKQLMPDMR
jgi:hypothetical protein